MVVDIAMPVTPPSTFGHCAAIEAYSFDNLANLTALANDEGFDNCYRNGCRRRRFCDRRPVADYFCWGRGRNQHVSDNIVNAVNSANGTIHPRHLWSRRWLYSQTGGVCVLIPCDRPEWTTPITEGVAVVVLHMIVSDSRLCR